MIAKPTVRRGPLSVGLARARRRSHRSTHPTELVLYLLCRDQDSILVCLDRELLRPITTRDERQSNVEHVLIKFDDPVLSFLVLVRPGKVDLPGFPFANLQLLDL